MQPFQCDLQPQLQETHRTTHTGTSILAKNIGGTNRVRNDRSRNRRTDEVPFIAGCSHFTRKNTRFRAPASSPQHSPCNIHAAIPMRTTSLRHHFPSSPLPFFTTSLRHHSPSSSLPFFTTSLRHHSPSSSLPFFTTSLRHHFPSSPLPFVHSPSSLLPFLTTSHRPRLPSSPFPFIITSLRHHFPSSPLPFVTTSLRHHFPSSPLPFVTTRHYHHPSSKSIPLLLILLLCIVMWSTTLASFQVAEFYLSVTRKYCFPTSFDYVLLYDLPPFLQVNFIASYSFVMYWYNMYCYIMYCYMIYHPSSRSISLLLILLWCIGTLCIVTWSTTLHHSQLHQVKVIPNSEVLLPNFLWLTTINHY